MQRDIKHHQYYTNVKNDFIELKQQYPYSTMYMPPTKEPQPVTIRVVAVHSNIINISMAEEEDFLREYSKELKIVVPWDYRENGCKVYGGEWINRSIIHKEDWHFYDKNINGLREFCVGVKASFCSLRNVILENVKTADNMLIAYEQVHRGVTTRANLIGYAHGEKGEREYEKDRRKYKSN